MRLTRRRVLLSIGIFSGTFAGCTARDVSRPVDRYKRGGDLRGPVAGSAEPIAINHVTSISSDKLVKSEAAKIGLKAVRKAVRERLDVSSIGSGISYPVGGPVISIDVGEIYDSDGEVFSEQVAPFEDVVAVTPSAVRVPVAVAERQVSHTIPVEVEETTTYLL